MKHPWIWLLLGGILLTGCREPRPEPRPATPPPTTAGRGWEREVLARVRREREAAASRAWQAEARAVQLYVLPGGQNAMMIVPICVVTAASGGGEGLPDPDLTTPTGLTAEVVTGEPEPYAVNLAWTYAGTTETGFQIERDGGSGFELIFTAAADSTGYSDSTSLVSGNDYSYRLRAVLPSGYSGYSSIAGPVHIP